MATSVLGPSLSSTLVVPNLDESIAAYCEFLHQYVHLRSTVSDALASRWELRRLAGMPMAWLANRVGEPWLRMIELPGASPVDPFAHGGWMSLEIAVQDVDGLGTSLESSPFEIIGQPANLDVSDDIRAMQVIGPAGEVLYLTEVKAEVPPFELPFARCAVDRLFIPVMLTDDRDRTLAEFEQFPGTKGLTFETKITVINRARNLEITHRHPVATIQLRGKNVIEIDQLDGLHPRPLAHQCLPTGIAVITFAIQSIPEDVPSQLIADGNYAGCRAAMMRGGMGERIELIETESSF